METMAQTRPRKKNSHIAVYAGDNQDFVNNGMTWSKFPKTAITLLWTRYQKSASFVLPFPEDFSSIDMAKALYPGTMAMARKRKLRDIKTTVLYWDKLMKFQYDGWAVSHLCIVLFSRIFSRKY